MADYTITEANVAAGTGTIQYAAAGEIIDAGEAVYLDTTQNQLFLSVATNSAKPCEGIAIGAAEKIGQHIGYQTDGTVTIGVTTGQVLAKGDDICVSSTAGKLHPFADLASGEYLHVVGFGASTTTVKLYQTNTGIDHV